MRKGFPNKILWIPYGWKDLGREDSLYNIQTGKFKYTVHSFCGARVHIGREAEGFFKFCPRCLLEVKEPNINEKKD